MGDYFRQLTVNDRDIPLATLQRAVPNVAIWSVDHPGMSNIMLDSWVELPQPSSGIVLHARRGTLPMPDPPEIPLDEDQL
jgi:hypothetical protein